MLIASLTLNRQQHCCVPVTLYVPKIVVSTITLQLQAVYSTSQCQMHCSIMHAYTNETMLCTAFNQLMMSECIVYCNTLCYCMHSAAADHATA
eukprot:6937-Heterococcus_DN1.PRE.6